MRRHFVATVVIFCVACDGSRGRADELRDRLLREAAPAWERYRQFATRLQGTITHFTSGRSTKDNVPADKPYSAVTVRLAPNCVLWQTMRPDGDRQVSLSNSRYSARLTGRDSRDGWLLATYADTPAPPTTANFNPVWDDAYPSVAPHLCRSGDPLEQVFRDPKCVIRSLREELLNGRRLVRVEFDYTPPQRPGSKDPTGGGWVRLDPAACWCVFDREIEGYDANGTGKFVVRYNYFLRDGEYPILTRTEGRIEEPPEDGRFIATRSEYDLRVADANELEFTLTAFGLPEPPGVTWERPTPRYVWLLAAAAVLAVVALVLRRLARRRTTSAPAGASP